MSEPVTLAVTKIREGHYQVDHNPEIWREDPVRGTPRWCIGRYVEEGKHVILDRRNSMEEAIDFIIDARQMLGLSSDGRP